MTSRDFCFWLQGYLEINESGEGPKTLKPEQVSCVQKHLSLVFEHEIDPSAGGPKHQATLNQIHHGPEHSPQGFLVNDGPLGPKLRC